MRITMLPICTARLPGPNLPFLVLPQLDAIRHHLFFTGSPVVSLGSRAVPASTACHGLSIAAYQASAKIPTVPKSL